MSHAGLESLQVSARILAAQSAFPLLEKEIERTTGQVAGLKVWLLETPSADNSWALGVELTLTNGGQSCSPVGWGPDVQSALVGIADFAMEWVSEAIGWPWPTCPEDNYGLDPELVDGRAVWRCRSARHEVVAAIGELGLV